MQSDRTTLQPIVLWGSWFVSATLHGCCIAIAMWGWKSEPLEQARFAGKQNVVYLQLTASTPALSSVAVMERMEIDATPVEEAESHEPLSELPPKALPIDRFTEAPLPSSVNVEVEPKEVVIEKKTETARPLEPIEVERPLQRRAFAQMPLPAQVAVVPEIAGTDATDPPQLTGNQAPGYPELAVKQRLQGTVWLKLYIDASGRITRVDLDRSSGHALLDDEAIKTVRTWKAQPAMKRGVPMSTVELLPVRFVLD